MQPNSSSIRPACRATFASVAFASVLSLAVGPLRANAADDALKNAFANPPDTAKPRVWWHWMDGNVTKEGIALDLAWMKRVGIGGVQNFDAAANTPTVVERRLGYMSPEWQDAFRYAVGMAEQEKLEFAIPTSAGWSESGGPWVTPEQAMKKLVWSTLDVDGGRKFDGVLPAPPHTTGAFQDAPMVPLLSPDEVSPEVFYKDVAVLAYKLPVIDARPLRASSGTGAVDVATLTDGRVTTGEELTAAANDEAWILYEYAQPQTMQAVSVALPMRGGLQGTPPVACRLEASIDGEVFSPVKEFVWASFHERTITFPPVTAKFFKLTVAPGPESGGFGQFMAMNAAPGFATDPNLAPPPIDKTAARKFKVTEFQLYTSARVHEFELKAGFAGAPDYYALDGSPVVAGTPVAPRDVIDLTSAMSADGRLQWAPPPGQWRIIRVGSSLLGKRNHPASREGTGLEVDKLSRAHVKAYLDRYLAQFEGAVGQEHVGRRGVNALLADSIESGFQNWTDDLLAEFQRRRGYDPRPWLPALTGVVVDSAAASDKFLWDYRRTIADLTAEAHYGQIAESAHARGMTVYGEALETFRPTLGDDMEMRRFTDVPMAALWYFKPEIGPNPASLADIRGAASVAHVYGQNLTAAESLTSALAPWAHAPRDLKPVIDLEFALGVNRPVIHTSVHQPLVDKKPGLPLIIFGQYFTRNETWAEQAGPWVSYIARNSYLLQQGRFVADVAYFYGEEAPLVSLFGGAPMTDAPEGHGFDFVNAHALLNLFSVDRGELVVPSGMRYRALYLGGTSRRMTLAVLKKLHALVIAGATVVGNRPEGSPSLADDAQEFARLADELWPQNTRGSSSRGQGRVLAGLEINAALSTLGLPADFSYTKPQKDTELLFQHRRIDDGDLYFVVNRKARPESVEITLRALGADVELWHADSGLTEKVSYRQANGSTIVPLALQPFESVFVVLRGKSGAASFAAPEKTNVTLASVGGGWDLKFDEQTGGPGAVRFDQLASWSERSEPGIKFYSGTARYTKSVEVPAVWLKPDARLFLDLGEVRELATVTVNGRDLGVLWHPPYRVDVTDALRAGTNTLEVAVTNLWVNRLIGDLQPGTKTKYTFTTGGTYNPDAPLRASGLIGPVSIIRSEEQKKSK